MCPSFIKLFWPDMNSKLITAPWSSICPGQHDLSPSPVGKKALHVPLSPFRLTHLLQHPLHNYKADLSRPQAHTNLSMSHMAMKTETNGKTNQEDQQYKLKGIEVGDRRSKFHLPDGKGRNKICCAKYYIRKYEYLWGTKKASYSKTWAKKAKNRLRKNQHLYLA